MQELIKVTLGDSFPDHYLITSDKNISVAEAIKVVARWMDENGQVGLLPLEGELVVGFVLNQAVRNRTLNEMIHHSTGIKIVQLPPVQTLPYFAGSGYTIGE